MHHPDSPMVDPRLVGLVGAHRPLRARCAAGPLLEFDPLGTPVPLSGAVAPLERLGEPRFLLVAAPISLLASGTPDLSAVAHLGSRIGPYLRPGQVVLLVDPVPPGTTRSTFAPALLERAGGVTVGALSVPATNAPGALGLLGGEVARVATDLTGIGQLTRPVATVELAELAGLTSAAASTFCAAWHSQVGSLGHRLGGAPWEALGSSAPVGFATADTERAEMLAWGARRCGATFDLLDRVLALVRSRPEELVARVAAVLNENGKPVRGSSITILGARPSEGPNRPDEIELATRLRASGGLVSILSPSEGPCPRAVPLLAHADCVVAAHAHAGWTYHDLAPLGARLVDACNALGALSPPRTAHGATPPHVS